MSQTTFNLCLWNCPWSVFLFSIQQATSWNLNLVKIHHSQVTCQVWSKQSKSRKMEDEASCMYTLTTVCVNVGLQYVILSGFFNWIDEVGWGCACISLNLLWGFHLVWHLAKIHFAYTMAWKNSRPLRVNAAFWLAEKCHMRMHSFCIILLTRTGRKRTNTRSRNRLTKYKMTDTKKNYMGHCPFAGLAVRMRHVSWFWQLQ